MIRVVIDGREIEVEQDTTVLEAAEKLNIPIPTLCYHKALEPYGVCRLCTVEVVRRGRSHLVTACNYHPRRDRGPHCLREGAEGATDDRGAAAGSLP
jgi:NADH dehydrogenase/NADH:ubiquinone oxidoreductase subunit G